jgi:hypothetical protein
VAKKEKTKSVNYFIKIESKYQGRGQDSSKRVFLPLEPEKKGIFASIYLRIGEKKKQSNNL